MIMRKPNAGRVVVVTGASAGVGRATVGAFAREQAHVGLIARDTEGLHVAAREVNDLGGKELAVNEQKGTTAFLGVTALGTLAIVFTK